MTVDVEFEDHQTQLAQVARDLFVRHNPPEVIRDLEAGEIGYSPELWREVAELGWLGIATPERYGGGGGGFLDLYPIFEELGRVLVPGPYLDTVGVAANLLLDIGSDAQMEEHLPAICAGESIFSVALLESSGGFGPADIDLRADVAGDGYALSGKKLLVGWVPSSTYLIVAARTSDSEEGEGVTLFLVPPSTAGVSASPIDNIAGGALFEVSFEDVHVAGAAVLGHVGRGWAPLSRSLTKAVVLQTATIVGAARSVLEMTNQYAKDREQFGMPIGRNQAVQYMVSDILFDMHRMDLLNRQAAFLIDVGRPHQREAAISAAFGKQASARLHRQAHEVHAGVAFIDEHDLTLYSLRAKYWENNLGDAAYYRKMVADVTL